MRELNKYIGIPFKAHGQSDAGTDCWGLVQMVYHDLLGVDLPSYHAIYDKVTDRANIDAEVARQVNRWRKVDELDRQLLDVVLLTVGKYRCHVGLYCEGGYMVHCDQSRGGVIAERLNSARWKNRVEGYYRYYGD